MNVSSMVAWGYAAKTASDAGNLYSSVAASDTTATSQPAKTGGRPDAAAALSDTVTISHAAWAALAASNASAASSPDSSTDNSVKARLAEIKAKDAISRTQGDWNYLFTNDKKLTEITAKEN